MTAATDIEILLSLHTLWKKGQLQVTQVKHLLLTTCSLKLTSITNGGITAESLDGKSKYSIK